MSHPATNNPMSQPATAPIPFVDLSCMHQPIADQIQQSIQTVIEQGDFVLGKALAKLETDFASLSDTQYGVGVASGTDAIALGLSACGIGPGDEVILPANTFIATLIGILRAGATPVMVDCDPATALIDLAAAEKAITSRTRAIIPVHLYGQMVSPRHLLDLASTYDLIVFEDAAQAHLAEREGYRAGSVGVAAAFSFYPSKNLGAFGDGGMMLTRDADVARLVRSLRNYGATRKYVHTEGNGTNSRLDSIQAAVLNVKLPHLATWNADRNRVARRYDEQLAPLRSQGLLPIENHSEAGHVYHLYVVRVTADCPIDRNQLQAQLAEQQISAGIHYPIPCHLQPGFQELGYEAGQFPQAEALSREILSLPMYPGLTDAQVDRVVDTIKTIVATAAETQTPWSSMAG
ncbi:MAG: DegT/DnrJ/EryC1/StrS family aminotransferase [Thainema sp.]